MKRFAKATTLAAAGLACGSLAAHAQVSPNDIVLGFTSSSSANDYIVDLGQMPASHQDFSSSISAFGTLFPGGNIGVNLGAVGGQSGTGFSQAGADAFITELRTGANATGSVGTESIFDQPSPASTISSVCSIPQGLTLGSIAKTDPTSFSYNIAQDPTTAGSKGNTSYVTLLGGENPLSAMESSTIALDLFEAIRTGSSTDTAWTYEGTLNLDFSSPGSPTLTFDPASAVPEPSTCGLMGVGLVLFFLRRRIAQKA